METDPPPTQTKYVSYPLFAAHDPLSKSNILKFAPSSNRKIEFDAFHEPLKLNRKDPCAIRKKAQEEKKGALESPGENGVKDEENNGRMRGNPDTKLAPASTRPARDESIVAPAPASQPKKTMPFKKKTKQVFIAADQAARMLKKEEYQSWLLEDSSPNGERWVGRYESAGAASGSSASPPIAASSNNDASNYVLLRMAPSGGAFQVIPCHRFYRFTKQANYNTLGADEAEEAYEKMQKPTTKEDVGRWFMRRRGANPSSQSSSQTLESTPKTSNDLKLQQDLKPASFFDPSQVSMGTTTKLRSQVEIPSFVNGRRNKFTAVHGSNSRPDEDRGPNFDQDSGFDEVDYDEQFDDDEEGAGNLNDEAMEQDELKELAERIKREMLGAGKAGDDEREKQYGDMATDREDLTKEGKAVKKLLMSKGEDDVYDSDDEVRNPYASEEGELDFEEVLPLPPNGASPADAKDPAPRAGTPGPSSQPICTSKGMKVNGSATPATNSKGDKPKSRPPRSGAPSLSGHPRTDLATPPVHGHALNTGTANRSRATTPQHPSSQFASLSHNTTNSNGKRKQPPNGAVTSKEKKLKLNSGGKDGAYFIPGRRASPDQNHGTIMKEQITNLLRIGPLPFKELLSHFKPQLKQESTKQLIFNLIKQVADVVEGRLCLRDGP